MQFQNKDLNSFCKYFEKTVFFGGGEWDTALVNQLDITGIQYRVPRYIKWP